MKGSEMLDIIENLDPAYIESAAVPRAKRYVWIKKCIAIAACLALMLSAGIGIYAYDAEVKEYNAAIKFFDAYDLSTEGLTRGEIKRVYRDITTESFSYSKTAEVITSSLTSDQIEGFEILQSDPTSEDLKNLWNYKNNIAWLIAPVKKGIHYKYDSEYKSGDSKILFDTSRLEKYDGERLIWRVYISEFVISGYTAVADGVIAYGADPVDMESEKSYSWMAKFDGEGNLVWKTKMNNGFDSEYIATVLENGDGSYAVISRGELKHLCLSQYSANGEKTYFKKTEVGNYGIWNAARIGDGYAVQLGSHFEEEVKIVKLDNKGNITESFSYSSEDSCYYISDMIEFNGKIYLSAYAVPKADPYHGHFYEIYNVVNYLHENDIREISDEKLTPMVRENYTAMLLVCDSSARKPQEFYSVKGSLGGELSLSNSGNLLWNVESITTTFYSPYTSSFTIGGTCYVFRYTFDNSGELISQEKTGETTVYRK